MNLRTQILDLKKQGLSYTKIAKKLGCTKSNVCYHLGDNQREKTILRSIKYKNKLPYITKLYRFNQKNRETKNITNTKRIKDNILNTKINLFSYGKRKHRGHKKMITLEEVKEKLGDSPTCYLTGRKIDINKPRTYHFDHIKPRSRAGENNIDNLGIACKEANQAKSDMLLEEFLDLCKEVLIQNGYEIVPVGFEPTTTKL